MTLYGTDTAQRLRRAGYPGVICVRSANATPEDEALYRRCGAAQGRLPPRHHSAVAPPATTAGAVVVAVSRKRTHREGSEGTPGPPNSLREFLG